MNDLNPHVINRRIIHSNWIKNKLSNKKYPNLKGFNLKDQFIYSRWVAIVNIVGLFFY